MRVCTDQHRSFSSMLAEERLEEDFLGKVRKLLDDEALTAELQGVGKDYDALPLFLALLLQHMNSTSDHGVQRALRRDLAWMGFCGYDPHSETPSAATICRFRNRLSDEGKWDRLLEVVNEQLSAHGVAVRNGQYLLCDGTFVASSVRPPPGKSQTDLEDQVRQARSAGKQEGRGEDWEAGFHKQGSKSAGHGTKVCYGTNEEGIVQAATTKPANVHEVKHYPEVLDKAKPRRGTMVLIDRAADAGAMRDELDERELRDGIMRRKPRNAAFSDAERARNKELSRIRRRIEKVFGTMKRTYGFRRTRYRGLAKVHGEAVLKAIVYNLARSVNMLAEG